MVKIGFWSDKVQEVRGPAQPAPQQGAWWQQGLVQPQPQAVSQHPQTMMQPTQIEQFQGPDLCPRCDSDMYGEFTPENRGIAGGMTYPVKHCFACGFGNRIDASEGVLHTGNNVASQAIRQAGRTIKTQKVREWGVSSGAGLGAWTGGRHDGETLGDIPKIA